MDHTIIYWGGIEDVIYFPHICESVVAKHLLLYIYDIHSLGIHPAWQSSSFMTHSCHGNQHAHQPHYSYACHILGMTKKSIISYLLISVPGHVGQITFHGFAALVIDVWHIQAKPVKLMSTIHRSVTVTFIFKVTRQWQSNQTFLATALSSGLQLCMSNLCQWSNCRLPSSLFKINDLDLYFQVYCQIIFKLGICLPNRCPESFWTCSRRIFTFSNHDQLFFTFSLD